ncbi:Uncharacterised protein [Mobiluncus curtisii subsp. curtisii]|nr:hypothetical protein [Mobiluncus curtisii]STY77515.1 Uncharacterised protein [Mobiluncus curtisii subsp. curtisii]
MLTCFHGVNNRFVAAAESQNNDFQNAPFGVETEAQFPLRVFLIEGLNPVWKRGDLQDVIVVGALLFGVFASGFPNIEAHAKAASRIRDERVTCLASARASSLASSSGVNRTATTRLGASPSPDVPAPATSPFASS